MQDPYAKQPATDLIAAFASVPMDLTGSHRSFRYGGGRDLSRLTRSDLLTDMAVKVLVVAAEDETA